MITYLWNTHEKRIRAAWRIILQVLLFFGFSGVIGAGLGLVGGIIVAFSQGFLKVIADPEGFALAITHLVDSPPVLNLVGSIISLAAMILSLLVTSRWIDRRRLADYGFHFNRRWWRDFGFGLELGLLLITIVFLGEYMAGWVIISGFAKPLSSGIPFGIELLMAFVIFIFAAVTEEIFSRGYQFRNIAEGMNSALIGPRMALLSGYLLSSVIFSSMHGFNPNASLLSTFNILVAGILLGMGYLLTGELAIPIGLHVAWNFTQGNVFGFPVSGTDAGATLITTQQRGPAIFTGGAFGPEGGLLGLLVMLLGCLITAWWIYRTRGQLKLFENLAVYSLEIPESNLDKTADPHIITPIK